VGEFDGMVEGKDDDDDEGIDCVRSLGKEDNEDDIDNINGDTNGEKIIDSE